MSERVRIKTTVNGEEREFLCEPRQSLLEVLRDTLLLTGTKEGCNNGNCGACNVIMDGVLVNSCLVLAVEAQDAAGEAGQPLERLDHVEGGDLGWQGPGTFVPEFQAVCETLEIDEISQPFKSPFGWHIVQLLERRVYDKTDEVERQQAIMAIRNSKFEEETELWARRLRDQAFVEYRL